ncbi:MAG: transglycosylase domain-containing protein [Spirochaetota bacterium]
MQEPSSLNSSTRNTTRSKGRKIIFLILLFLILVPTLFIGTSYGIWLNNKKRVVGNLQTFKKEVTQSTKNSGIKPIKIYDKNNVFIGEFYRRNYRPIRTENLKSHAVFIWALLASEDRAFFEHGGINYRAVIRAIGINLSKLTINQGGSTITQQLAKLTLNLGKRSIINKLAEVFCTYHIEATYSKNEILAMYVNQIYMGSGNTGIEAASRFYFNNLKASRLTPEEAAMLVGIIPAPSLYNPVRNLRIALTRQKRILRAMANNKDVNKFKAKVEANFANKIDARIVKFRRKYIIKEYKDSKGKTRFTSKRIAASGYDRQFGKNLAPDFNETIRQYVLKHYSAEELDSRDIKVFTSLDIKKQKIAQAAMKEGLVKVRAKLRKRQAAYKKKGNEKEVKRETEIIRSMNGSLISMDPETGYIEALVGSEKISKTYRLNRAEAALRQPGSAIKGLIYTLALEKKIITPSTIVNDEKININGYSPKNWYRSYKGPITARQALAQSVNTIPVKLLQEIGVNLFLHKLSEILSVDYKILEKRMGNNLSLALGAGELTSIELATIYATLANGGRRIRPKRIIRIEDKLGKNIYNNDEDILEGTPILDPVACAMGINLLQAVLSPEGTFPIRLNEKQWFPMAGKTGTVQSPKSVRKKWSYRKGVRDAWFVGLFPGIVTAIWVGNDKGAPFPGSGSGVSGRIWIQYARSLKQLELMKGDTIVPKLVDGFTKVDICGDNGKLLKDYPECENPVYSQYYYSGEEPKDEDFADGEVVQNPNLNANDEPVEEGIILEENKSSSQEDLFSEDDNLIQPFDVDEEEPVAPKTPNKPEPLAEEELPQTDKETTPDNESFLDSLESSTQ